MSMSDEERNAKAAAELAAMSLGGLHRRNATAKKSYQSGSSTSPWKASSSTYGGAQTSQPKTTKASSYTQYGSTYSTAGTGQALRRTDSNGVSECGSIRDSTEWKNYKVSPLTSPAGSVKRSK